MRALFVIVGLFALFGCAAAPKMVAVEKPSFCEGFKAEVKDNLGDESRAFIDYYGKYEERKLIVFMDGTGNTKKDLSNVYKLYRLAVQQACNDKPVIPYYDRGVGTEWYDFFGGSVLGTGVNKNIRQAYSFLVESYKPGDQIYLIGFSRGAFTARSLNGLIEFAGILDRNSIKSESTDFTVKKIFSTYDARYDGTASFDSNLKEKVKNTIERLAVKAYPVKVTAIGVFDTVPAIGPISDEEPDKYRLDLYALNGFHALSLDEQRNSFRVLRFDDFRVDTTNQKLVEVWFAGVHTNIGGGYAHSFDCNITDKSKHNYYDGLEAAPLNWMIKNFEPFKIFPEDKKYIQCEGGRLHDEFFKKGIMRRIYRDAGIFKRKPRIGDSIHESVAVRMDIKELKYPHNEREPKGQYLFMNLPHPVDSHKFFSDNGFKLVE